MPKTKYQIYSVKDKGDQKVVKKERIFDLPMRILLVGKSGSGKGVVGTSNFLLLPEFYGDSFQGQNIYIFSKSLDYDYKTKLLIKMKDVPKENLFRGLDDSELHAVIDFIEEQYLEAESEGRKPDNVLIILDDVQEDLKQKHKNSAVNELYIRGRHLNISTMSFLQYYSKLPSVARVNATGLIIFELPKKQIDIISDEHNFLENKKDFYKLYLKAIEKHKHGFFVINYSNNRHDRYLDSEFEVIDLKD